MYIIQFYYGHIIIIVQKYISTCWGFVAQMILQISLERTFIICTDIAKYYTGLNAKRPNYHTSANRVFRGYITLG